MEALIDAALERRRTGKYPEVLKAPPVDPYSGKPMKYRVGQVPMRRICGTDEKADIRFESHPGVAVWSVGPNGIDEDGANGHDCGGDERDDIRALIALPERP